MKTLTLAIITALSLNSAWAGNGPGRYAGQHTQAPTATTSAPCPVINPNVQLSATDATSLAFMREEEKLAHDVYLSLAGKWQMPIFGNIAQAEQNHSNQVKCLLDAYALPDSVLNEAGKFNNTELQSLYDSLITRGATSLVEALRVGALIEEVDIKDLQDAIAVTQITDIKMVYGKLLQGSQNHLRAFTNTLALQGESYTAQVLPQEAVADAVANANTNNMPVVLDLNTMRMNLDHVQLSQGGQLLPFHYRATLRLSPDGRSFVIEQTQVIRE